MKILITEVCTGKPDGVTEVVYTDGREYDLPEGLAKKLMDEGKGQLPPTPSLIKEHPSGYKGEPKVGELKKSKKEVGHGKE